MTDNGFFVYGEENSDLACQHQKHLFRQVTRHPVIWMGNVLCKTNPFYGMDLSYKVHCPPDTRMPALAIYDSLPDPEKFCSPY